MTRMHVAYILLSLALLIASCQKKEERASLFPGTEASQADDMEAIRASGEIIVGTLSGPDSYFELAGEALGTQYALADNFAKSEGVGVRMEIAHSEEELCAMLDSGKVDLAAYQLADSLLRKFDLVAAGAKNDSLRTSWAVRKDMKALAAALDKWYTPNLEQEIAAGERERETAPRQVTFTARPEYLSRPQGIISSYDDLFRSAARTAGYDWRLLAAIAYTESGFDPNAVSRAGARGLMQLMPSTARSLGVDPSVPAQNIDGAARLLKQLQGEFADIRHPVERAKFVLAAYNGGGGHIRDAMALASKYGRNPVIWADVSEYILRLSEPQYYRDPVVRHGYMIGRETVGYVSTVAARYVSYGGNMDFGPSAPAIPHDPGSNAPQNVRRQNNRFTQGTEIAGPDDPVFNE
ncbi:MAG: transglycosylase SLT domain-containing protein [Alloprevotella sp.]|nr:transglycosylase SLT domain-containing protein [Alloprevotella sp.]